MVWLSMATHNELWPTNDLSEDGLNLSSTAMRRAKKGAEDAEMEDVVADLGFL